MRFAPTTSAAALASKVAQECETAEPFCESVVVVGANKVGVMTKPSITSGMTGEYLNPGDTAEVVARTYSPRDGRVYLRLKALCGWVSTRSRKEYNRLVIASLNDKVPLEPPRSHAAAAAAAAELLPHLDEQGKPAGAATTPASPPGLFRVATGRCQLLTAPDLAKGIALGALPPHEVFEADGVHLRADDGRAYLRIKGGRGWVSERMRNDFGRLAVEPVEEAGGDLLPARGERSGTAPRRQLHRLRASAAMPPPRKVAVVERRRVEEVPPAASLAAVAERSPRLPRPTMALYRSDGELWPEGAGPSRPVTTAVRERLRQLQVRWGQRVREAEEDLQEVEEQANSYQRACTAQRELKEYAEQLRKEMTRVNSKWAGEVKALVAEAEVSIGDTGATATGISEAGVYPVQVDGQRWYCAASGEGAACAEGAADSGPGRRVGPVRRTAAEAVADLKHMREGSGGIAERKDDSEQPVKRRRTTASGDGRNKNDLFQACANGGC